MANTTTWMVEEGRTRPSTPRRGPSYTVADLPATRLNRTERNLKYQRMKWFVDAVGFLAHVGLRRAGHPPIARSLASTRPQRGAIVVDRIVGGGAIDERRKLHEIDAGQHLAGLDGLVMLIAQRVGL